MRRVPWRPVLVAALVGTSLVGVAAPAARAHAVPASGPADPVLAWSGYAQQAIVADAPAASPVLLGIAHVAMYDTAVSLGLRAEPFLHRERAASHVSAKAAVATATYGVLVARLPGQRDFLTTTYQRYLADIPAGQAKRNGVDLGGRVAARVLFWRAGDGLDGTVPYEQRPPGPGVWEPTAPTPPIGLALTRVRPLSLRAIDQIRPTGPDALFSGRYARDLAEVQRLGRLDSAVRTARQTQTVQFWSENAAVQWNRAVHRIVIDRRLNLGAAARLLAAVHVSVGDATLACFDAKYHYRFWRPAHAIPRADTDGNPATEPDPTWQPLLNVNHPEYPSGHACLTGAAVSALRQYFDRDEFRYRVDSTVTGTTRRYTSFHTAIDEASDARVWAGLHLRNSMHDGGIIGQRAARWVASHHFRTWP
jgi:hypothetical protein